jgi:hypothetical protein
VVEGARLESVYAGNRIAGSNPAPSASYYVLDVAYIIVFLGSLFLRVFPGVTGLVSKAICGRDVWYCHTSKHTVLNWERKCPNLKFRRIFLVQSIPGFQ